MEIIAGSRASLWWDMESCPLPSYVDPYIVASMAPALLRYFNIIDVNGGGGSSCAGQHYFSAFRFFSQTETELDQTLINSGIELNQLPTGRTSYEMEKMMMADVLLWAMDTPPPADIIFIVGNVDFCYVFQKLRERSYNVFLVCQSMIEMPQGMLGGVNDCMGWLSFLRSLQNEDQLSHISGGMSVYNHPAFSNTALPTSSSSIHSKDMEESSGASGIQYSRENLINMKPYLTDGWGTTSNFPDGWDSTCNFLLEETTSSPVQPEPRSQDHFIKTKKPMRPKEKKKLASLEEFKAWLTLVVNRENHEHGYYIWRIRKDFQKATGKLLNEKSLGFSNTKELVEDCKDIAVLKEPREGCYIAFPVKGNEQRIHQCSSITTRPGKKSGSSPTVN